jgi:hypothetical protein
MWTKILLKAKFKISLASSSCFVTRWLGFLESCCGRTRIFSLPISFHHVVFITGMYLLIIIIVVKSHWISKIRPVLSGLQISPFYSLLKFFAEAMKIMKKSTEKYNDQLIIIVLETEASWDWASNVGEDVDSGLVGCGAVWSYTLLTLFYTAVHPRRQIWTSYSPPWELEISHC